jgi:hypothetical protein
LYRYSQWKAEELLCMVEAAGQPLLSAMTSLKRDAGGRVAKVGLCTQVESSWRMMRQGAWFEPLRLYSSVCVCVR